MFEHLFDDGRPRAILLEEHVKNKVRSFKEFMAMH
jgi:hypothetical protein